MVRVTQLPVADRDQIVEFLDDLLEIDRFDDLGPIGMQVPGAEQVGRVATGVSGHLELFQRAAETNADLVIVHHGILWEFHPRTITPQLKERLKTLFDANMTLASYHLPLDAHREVGNNALLCKRLGFELEPERFGLYRGLPIGVIGSSVDGMPLAELKDRTESELGQRPFIFEEGPDPIRRIGFLSGGATGNFAEAIELGLDAYFTGEASEHVMADARESNTHFIAAGHYATEKFGVIRLGELVAEKFGIEHTFIDCPNPI